eukprot:CAMPEP_0197620976 /NCGR_PEP_ID=MMETSP1338-20131121/1650_1 /TAXON_ID=43686 ORGANISM="Pelagodinium beii, Strain RCC1491" /NCGR_SAMPLE_ID=MMETSP1338 /ASSEMBLY_ACC=CAM_ASM_000754 /LENGTH=353 /DNA_ID=CAMNT_0043190293 /DNA_START=63 /DNA_END=1124 /DNA_ORIENTATION=+
MALQLVRSCLALTAAWSVAGACTGGGCSSQTAGGMLVQLQSQAAKAAQSSMRACPATEEGQTFGNVQTSQVDECSGLAASRVNLGFYWVNNDSGAGPNLYAIDKHGKHVARLYVHGSSANDWEDIAVGPGPQEGASYIYIADTGDNYRSRGSVQIYRVMEPQVPEGRDRNDDIHVSAEKFDIRYPDGSHDCEAMFVDQGAAAMAAGTVGRVYIITKGDNRNSDPRWGGGDLFYVDLPNYPAGDLTFQPANAHLPYEWITGADISPDGHLIAVRSYGEVLMWPRNALSVEESLKNNNVCYVNKKGEQQGEAIAFGANSDHYITVSEGRYPPVWYFALPESFHNSMLNMALTKTE